MTDDCVWGQARVRAQSRICRRSRFLAESACRERRAGPVSRLPRAIWTQEVDLMSRFRVPVLCAAWLLAARLPGQDLTVVSKTTFGNAESTSTQFITSQRSRSSSRDNDSIVSFADGKVTFVAPRRRGEWG